MTYIEIGWFQKETVAIEELLIPRSDLKRAQRIILPLSLKKAISHCLVSMVLQRTVDKNKC